MDKAKQNIKPSGAKIVVSFNIPAYLYWRFRAYATKLGISQSELASRLLLEGLKNKLPKDEVERLQMEHSFWQAMEMEQKLFKAYKQVKRSGAWIEKTLNEEFQGARINVKLPLMHYVSGSELELLLALAENRQKLMDEASTIGLKLFPRTHQYTIEVVNGKYHVRRVDEVLQTYKLPYSPPNSIEPCTLASETPFMDYVRQKSTLSSSSGGS
ncbi:MAG: hypothetical protein ACPLVJ_02015 [Candidatus Bathyarchaeales archaeon]